MRIAALACISFLICISLACASDSVKVATDSSGASTSTVVKAQTLETIASTVPEGTEAPVSTSVPPDTVAQNTQDSRSIDALEVLASLSVSNEVNDGYVRDLFRHWIDEDGNGCDTRQEVLKRDSLSLPQIDPFRCKVMAGDWYSPYDGTTWSDPADVDIDHVVALKEAWGSGAWQWDEGRRRAFANDLTDSRSLMAVTDSVNQSKGDRDPSQWLPPKNDYRCTYLSIWLSIKARWSLAVDPSEAGAIRAQLEGTCKGLRVAKWVPVPIA